MQLFKKRRARFEIEPLCTGRRRRLYHRHLPDQRGGETSVRDLPEGLSQARTAEDPRPDPLLREALQVRGLLGLIQVKQTL